MARGEGRLHAQIFDFGIMIICELSCNYERKTQANGITLYKYLNSSRPLAREEGRLHPQIVACFSIKSMSTLCQKYKEIMSCVKIVILVCKL